MFRSLVLLTMLCLLAIPAQAMAYNPLTLVYEANNLRVEITGHISGHDYTDVTVLAKRPDGSIVRGGPCDGIDGDRCQRPLTETLNHVHPDGPGPSAVQFTGAGIILVCHRTTVGGLTGIVGDCSTAGQVGVGLACDGIAGAKLGECVSSAVNHPMLLWERVIDTAEHILDSWEILGLLTLEYWPMALAG